MPENLPLPKISEYKRGFSVCVSQFPKIISLLYLNIIYLFALLFVRFIHSCIQTITLPIFLTINVTLLISVMLSSEKKNIFLEQLGGHSWTNNTAIFDFIPLTESEMATVMKSVSNEWRKKGNELYLSASNDLAPCVRQERIKNAITCYSKALELKTNDEELSSAAKNLAMASWRVAKLATENYVHVFYLKEASKYFRQAYDASLSCKPPPWKESLLSNTSQFLDDVVQFSQTLKFELRSKLLNEIACQIPGGTLKANCYLQLADTVFKAGISELSAGRYKECLKLMHECYTPIEEARRYGHHDPFIEAEVRVYNEDIFIHQCTSESIQARVTGGQLFETLLQDEDSLNIDMVWEVVDWYKQSILLTRERDVEFEAIGHSRLGKVYDRVLKLKNKAKENFMRCLELVNSMHPRNFTSEKWYQDCTKTIERYQRETVQQEEDAWSKEKNEILLELKDELDKLEQLSNNAEDLLKHIYKVHPPKNQNHKLNKSLLSGETRNIKKALRDGLLHYHPDRLRAKDLGQKWVVLCEEITKYLNRKYEVYK